MQILALLRILRFMKVTIIHNLYPPYARGGAEQVVCKTVQGLVDSGHHVVVITLAPDREEREIQGNVIIYRIRPKNIFSYLDAQKKNLFSRFLWHVFDIWNKSSEQIIKNILEQEKPDVVHTHNLMGIGFLIPRVIRALNIPHVHTVHDVQLVEPSGIILKKKENSFRYTGMFVRLYALLMRSLLGSPNVIISPSQFLLQFYEKWGFFPVSNRVVLRNPVFLDHAPEEKVVRPVCKFLYVGQIETHKGVFFLVQSFLRFIEQTPGSSELHIVGTGSQMKELEIMCAHQDAIILHGKVPHDQLKSFFERSDITIVPSLCYENSPTVIFESFSSQTPVLASNIEGIAELIKEGENGRTFSAGDMDSLQKLFLWCIQNRESVKIMGKNGRNGILSLSKEKYLEKLLGWYTSIQKKFI